MDAKYKGFTVYRLNSSETYACFIDLSTAFDLVDHLKLFEKLKTRNMPMAVLEMAVRPLARDG